MADCAALAALTRNTLSGRYPIAPAANLAPHLANASGKVLAYASASMRDSVSPLERRAAFDHHGGRPIRPA